MNLAPLWQSPTATFGKRAIVVIPDDGIQMQHPDLKANIARDLAWDYVDDDDNPEASDIREDTHGVQLAGIIAAEANNGKCSVGIAFQSLLVPVRLLDSNAEYEGDFELASAMMQPHKDPGNQRVVVSVSFGPVDSLCLTEGPGRVTAQAMRHMSTNQGRVYVWAGGNGRAYSDTCSFDGFIQNVFTIGVAAVGSTGQWPSYSEECAALLISAPSGSGDGHRIVTTDLMGADGENKNGLRWGRDLDCTTGFSGTSATAPAVAAIVALLADVLPEEHFNYRAVQHILARSANIDMVRSTGDFVSNAAGVLHSYRFGFGVADAAAAVALARIWTPLPPLKIWASDVVSFPEKERMLWSNRTGASDILPWDLDSSGNYSDPPLYHLHVQSQITVPFNETVEVVQVRFTAAATNNLRWRVVLRSPANGTTSRLASYRSGSRCTTTSPPFVSWPFMTLRHWNESTAGVWTLDVYLVDRGLRRDGQNLMGEAQSWQLVLWGSGESFVHTGDPDDLDPRPTPPTQTEPRRRSPRDLVIVFAVLCAALTTMAVGVAVFRKHQKRSEVSVEPAQAADEEEEMLAAAGE